MNFYVRWIISNNALLEIYCGYCIQSYKHHWNWIG